MLLQDRTGPVEDVLAEKLAQPSLLACLRLSQVLCTFAARCLDCQTPHPAANQDILNEARHGDAFSLSISNIRQSSGEICIFPLAKVGKDARLHLDFPACS